MWEALCLQCCCNDDYYCGALLSPLMTPDIYQRLEFYSRNNKFDLSVSYLYSCHLKYWGISCNSFLAGGITWDSCPSRWVPHNSTPSDVQQLTVGLPEEWFSLVTSWSLTLLIHATLGMHNIRQDWCCEAAEVSCNLHWLFDCVTNTHWTDGSTQRITEPCRLLGNTCPLWQTSTTTHITWTALQHMSKGIGAGWCSFYPSKSKHAVLGTNIQHTVEGTMCPAECRIKSYNCNISLGGGQMPD